LTVHRLDARRLTAVCPLLLSVPGGADAIGKWLAAAEIRR
jgi:hypothetical protein